MSLTASLVGWVVVVVVLEDVNNHIKYILRKLCTVFASDEQNYILYLVCIFCCLICYLVKIHILFLRNPIPPLRPPAPLFGKIHIPHQSHTHSTIITTAAPTIIIMSTTITEPDPGKDKRILGHVYIKDNVPKKWVCAGKKNQFRQVCLTCFETNKSTPSLARLGQFCHLHTDDFKKIRCWSCPNSANSHYAKKNWVMNELGLRICPVCSNSQRSSAELRRSIQKWSQMDKNNKELKNLEIMQDGDIYFPPSVIKKIDQNNIETLKQRPIYYRNDYCRFCKVKRIADKRTIGHKDHLKRCTDCYKIHQFNLLNENDTRKIELLKKLRETYRMKFIERIIRSKKATD